MHCIKVDIDNDEAHDDDGGDDENDLNLLASCHSDNSLVVITHKTLVDKFAVCNIMVRNHFDEHNIIITLVHNKVSICTVFRSLIIYFVLRQRSIDPLKLKELPSSKAS